MARHAGPPRDEEAITDVSEAVYRLSLGERAVALMLKTDGDDGAKLRRRARANNALTARYMIALGVPIPRLSAVNGAADDAAEILPALFD